MKKRRAPSRKPDRAPEKIVETGAIVKKGRDLIKAALVYPNTYKAGMSSLGFQAVYTIANRLDHVACERVFLPDKKRKDTPSKSVETGLSLNQFDIILFSISFENDFNHLVHLLGEAGIPLRSSDRNHIHPLVAAGGVACFLNPEPIAPFIDCFLLGEAEGLLENFFKIFSPAGDKDQFLTTLEEKVPGAYVPRQHQPGEIFSIPVQYVKSLEHTTTASRILTSGTAFKNAFLIEILKGCPHGCRFCSAGFIYRPPRTYPLQNIRAAMDQAVGQTEKIGLVSSAVADHPDITDICQYGLEKNFKLSFSSLRADKLSDALIQSLSDSKVKTATIAPEAGSERMRRIINKKITEPDILSAAERLVSSGIINLRLYFMIGLPFETKEDVAAIVELTKKIKEAFLAASQKKKKIGTITLSINPFVPKPATPFQWAAMETEKSLKQKVSFIKNGLKKVANVTVQVESLRKAKISALLSLGDQRTADIIEFSEKDGWTAAMRHYSDYCDDVIYREKDPDAPLPWDFLDNRVSKNFLKKEYLRAKVEKKSPACPMIACDRCGVCINNNILKDK